ncbi:ABC transporter permease [Rariglobus hedericola]|uniref:ABC transporter permease n=1 Tax=Rariglobus hedericola TaxID=2597822 RepID=A0A556QGH2_9BACT|nr:ABC transporter permease [Rariglobus hedericola]TSJ75738.1 ABC transporter permease [Rariglobus hedericola]
MIVTRTQKTGFSFYAGLVLLVFYFPVFCIIVASLSKKRFFSFPYTSDDMTFKWYNDAINSPQVHDFVGVSLRIAGITAVASVAIGFFSALAYARYRWRGRQTFQRLVLLPLFFPQSVLGLALLMWFSFLDVTTAWWTAAIAHTVWIAPITTLIISIQAYGLDESLEEAARDMGATRWQIMRKITIPLLLPGMISATCFAVLLSWGNFALSLYTTGADSALPEWLYARMTSGYQPMVPAVGVINVGVAIILVIALFAIVRWSTRKSRHSTSSH